MEIPSEQNISYLLETKKYVEETFQENKARLRKIRAKLKHLGQLTDRLDRMAAILGKHP